MKKGIILLSLLGLAACDPAECTEEVISNKTTQDVYVLRYGAEATTSSVDEFFIKSNSIEEIEGVNCSKGGVIISYENYDSVVVNSFDGIRLKTYYPNSAGKNIYNVEEDWVIENLGKRSKRYTFEITEEDINNSDTEK